MTFVYPDPVCIETGDLPQFYFTGEASHVPARYFRWGAQREAIADTSRAGVCIAAFDPGVTRETLDARSGCALFVVRDKRSAAQLLVVLPLFTYHAYNVAHVDGTLGEGEGECLYSGAKWVSLHRPGGGIGGHPWDEVNADAYDRDSPRQTFAHWDAKAIAWLERSGFYFDCCTDLELDDPAFDLSRYRAVVSFGHHEYWTQSMRDRLDAFIESGGNAAFFGGNTCWFRAEYDRAGARVRRAGRWTANPEWHTTGVSYAYGGGKWIGERPPCGYRIHDASCWIFTGLSAHDGEVFGAQERLVGYECDGAASEGDMQVLAQASIADWPVNDGSGEVSQAARATLGIRRNQGTVFTASTVDWARVLERGNRIVEGITRNVLERFLG